MAAHAAAPVLGIFCDAHQQFTRARRLDHRNSAIAGGLRQLHIERHQEVQALAVVAVEHGEQCGIGAAEIGLIDRDLCGVLRITLFEPVTVERALALRVDAFAFP